MDLIFATNNINKINEIRQIIPAGFNLITLHEAGIKIDIPEPHDSLRENASEKSQTIYKLTGKSCFSEDTGLEVDALDGAPGVRSARFAKADEGYSGNNDKLLKLLGHNPNRHARFRTVISLILEGEEYFFEGKCEGTILMRPKGSNGFGYDPVFVPDGGEKSFGEMSMEEKKTFSHRRKAMDLLIAFLHKRS
ncbi:RdgB/HAM1 family non-canonical purine NTP pyrophosphatase [Flavihumibacter sp. ZG627]|uniref:RdgB/HAM1 family non-canonical purine NTP pyrophosphatase n=1 Tax=Flavihumibacter sp. ZG627 TaxID=1463156 RepID=UPI00057D83B8|nr:RdgB/HAM1 family non-canonical purine NTP pyrophosphatase [Flavihumibacter sp. ZG627]KIC89790.1 deoxyribonucleotide triphosphate pyrophosphatase [Flavihumibacter sp. ZG627]